MGKVWEHYYNLFIDKISYIVNDKVVLEIGCPSGKLATRCNDYKKWYIVDPNKNDKIQFNENIVFIQDFFDNNFTSNERIDFILHSHLFEHIYEPNIFLQKCHELLSDEGEMVFGVPNMEHLTKVSLFLGIFFEHTIFLNKTNITYLLNKNGFEILQIIDYEKHSTIYHVRKSKIVLNVPECKVYDYLEQFFTMNSDNTKFVNICNSTIDNNPTKPVYIFGASYNTQYLLSIGIDETRLTGVLDNCKEKQNKYLYGSLLKIYSPEIVRDTDSIVILKNGYYTKEIAVQLKSINPNILLVCNEDIV